jgi:hypothetical protein
MMQNEKEERARRRNKIKIHCTRLVICMTAALFTAIITLIYGTDCYRHFKHDNRFTREPFGWVIFASAATIMFVISIAVDVVIKVQNKGFVPGSQIRGHLNHILYIGVIAAWMWAIVIISSHDMIQLRRTYISLYALIICQFAFLSTTIIEITVLIYCYNNNESQSIV